MGAEVIKVEAPGSWDLTRSLALLPSSVERPYNKSAYFNHYGRNKYGCVIDLATPPGREIALRLVAISDVVVENYRSDVLERLGLDFETLRSARDDVILVSMPSHGLWGPDAFRIGYGTHMEQLTGVTSLSGYPDGPPQRSGISYGDPVAGTVAAAAAIGALLYRRWTGRGQHIEVAQLEALLPLIGEFFLDYQITGREHERAANRHSSMAPHGVYQCAGEDSWIAIAVENDAQFAALSRIIDRPELVSDARFADVVSRHRNQEQLDAIISEWIAAHSHRDAAELLTAAGVPASPVLTIPELVDDPHLAARGFWEQVTHREAGTWTMDGPAWSFDLSPAHVRLPAPCFGEHNVYVLRDLLGLTPADVDALERDGVIAREPVAGQDV
jgi:crotonobetainyl-CoA:carnitine CoA-transferase CaiB-like acyl-CoA transferase